jgi:hypothetical protein
MSRILRRNKEAKRRGSDWAIGRRREEEKRRRGIIHLLKSVIDA